MAASKIWSVWGMKLRNHGDARRAPFFRQCKWRVLNCDEALLQSCKLEGQVLFIQVPTGGAENEISG